MKCIRSISDFHRPLLHFQLKYQVLFIICASYPFPAASVPCMLHPFNFSRADSRARRVELRSFPLAAFVFMNALRPPLIGRRPPLPPSCSRGAVGQGEKAIKRNRALPPSFPLSLRCSAPLTFFSVSGLPPPPVAAATTAAVGVSLPPRTLSTERATSACNLLYGYFCPPPSSSHRPHYSCYRGRCPVAEMRTLSVAFPSVRRPCFPPSDSKIEFLQSPLLWP